MCGIAGFYIKPGVKTSSIEMEKFTDQLLLGIDNRGGDACGFLALTDSKEVRVQKAAVRAVQFNQFRRPLPKNTRIVLLHTRFATQGLEDFPENNHPFNSGPIWGIHNGHVMNDDELIAKYGFERKGQVDSEAIAHSVRGNGWDNIVSAFEEIDGHAAVAMLNADTGDLCLARLSSSPLIILETSKYVIWASTAEAIKTAWGAIIGTPPNAKKFKWTVEGDAYFYYFDGTTGSCRFNPVQPAWYTRSTGSQYNWSDDNYQFAGMQDSNADYDPEAEFIEVVGTFGSTFRFRNPKYKKPLYANCSGCGHRVLQADLYEVFDDIDLCPDCENDWFGQKPNPNWDAKLKEQLADTTWKAYVDKKDGITDGEEELELDDAERWLMEQGAVEIHPPNCTCINCLEESIQEDLVIDGDLISEDSMEVSKALVPLSSVSESVRTAKALDYLRNPIKKILG